MSTPTAIPEWQNAAAFDALRQVRTFVRRTNRWHAHVAAHMADPTQPYNVRLMPSKVAKHQAYDAASRYVRLMQLPPSTMPHTFAGLAALVGEPDRVTR